MAKKAKRKFGDAIRASIRKEMAKPRMSKSAREREITLAARIDRQPRTNKRTRQKRAVTSNKRKIAHDTTDVGIFGCLLSQRLYAAIRLLS